MAIVSLLFPAKCCSLRAAAVYCDWRRKKDPACPDKDLFNIISLFQATFVTLRRAAKSQQPSYIFPPSSSNHSISSLLPWSHHPPPAPASPSVSAPFGVPDDSSETSVSLLLHPSRLSSLSSPRGAWHQCPSHRQMEPTLTPLLARGDAKRINA